MDDFTRRDLLAGGASLVTLMALGGCESIQEAIRNRPVRRDISRLANNDITLQTYRAGVQAMKDLPPSDPRNWNRFAELHYDFCPHGNWFFLPWHRAYMLSLERIIRTLTNTPSFGLPYWNWRCNRSVPGPFWVADSTLNHPRDATASDQANEDLVGYDNLNEILAETDFELFASGAASSLGESGFQGRLESQPHNHIHPFVGGDMGGYRSPRDPVFWTHHNQIDYLWYLWNSRGNANTNDSTYTQLVIDHMVDGDGNPMNYQVGALVLAPLLSYRFEGPRPCLSRLDPAIFETVRLRRFLEQGAAIRFRPSREFAPSRGLRIAFGQRQAVRMALPAEAVAMVAPPGAPDRLLLRLQDVTPPSGDDFFIQVYLGLREGERPTPESPSYAGAFAFFSDETSGHHRMTHNYVVDLSGAVARLRAAGRPGGTEVTLVAVPNLPGRSADGVVSIGAIAPVAVSRRAMPRPVQ